MILFAEAKKSPKMLFSDRAAICRSEALGSPPQSPIVAKLSPGFAIASVYTAFQSVPGCKTTVPLLPLQSFALSIYLIPRLCSRKRAAYNYKFASRRRFTGGAPPPVINMWTILWPSVGTNRANKKRGISPFSYSLFCGMIQISHQTFVSI